MFPSIARRAISPLGRLLEKKVANPTDTFRWTAETNPYRAKHLWPPDFKKLDHKHQFRLERRYRRRAKLAWARPGWNKFWQLAQWVICGSIVVYGVFFMDWHPDVDMEGHVPFEGVSRARNLFDIKLMISLQARRWLQNSTNAIWPNPISKEKRVTAPRRGEEGNNSRGA